MKYLLLAVLVLLSACEKRVTVTTDPTTAYKRGRFQSDGPGYEGNVTVVEDLKTGQEYILCYHCQLTPLKAKEAP